MQACVALKEYLGTMHTAVLEELVTLNPKACWWIKGDGTDVVKGLCQSVAGEWSGDVDLGDGKLQEQYKEFCQRVDRIEAIGLEGKSVEESRSELVLIRDMVEIDLKFISSGICCICLKAIARLDT